MTNRKPKVLWILMHHGSEGWLPRPEKGYRRGKYGFYGMK